MTPRNAWNSKLVAEFLNSRITHEIEKREAYNKRRKATYYQKCRVTYLNDVKLDQTSDRRTINRWATNDVATAEAVLRFFDRYGLHQDELERYAAKQKRALVLWER